MRPLILVVEDEPGLAMTLSDRLAAEGYDAVVARDGFTGERLAAAERPDAIILDVMLPGRSGLELCRRLRAAGNRTPILMLTALQAVDDRVAGLREGADDYLGKPFAMDELLARLEALLRRAPPERGAQRVGAALLDRRATRVTRDGKDLELSARLYALLEHFVDHAGETLTREQLLEQVWGHREAPNTRTVDVHVGWLRRAIEADPGNPRHLVTVHGIGYRLDLDPG